MAGPKRWNGRVLVALLVLLGGTLVSVSIHHDDLDNAAPEQSPGVLAAPELTITLARGKLGIVGTSQSTDHEAVIAQVVADRFPDRIFRREFTAGILVPGDWEPVSVRLLYVMSAMESATATMQRDQVSLRGVTAQPEVFNQRLAFLREAMSTGNILREDVIFVDDAIPLDDLCRRAFAELGALPVAFAESSAELRESSYPGLDRVVDFAWDCSTATILIAGHTDASGNESWNLRLSRARAQAVADYLGANGVDPERLVIEGRGSSEPVADNDTRYGRSLNRRIEFGLHPPLL